MCYTHPYELNELEYFPISYLKLLQDDRIDPDDLQLDFPVGDAAREEAKRYCDDRFKPPVAALFGVGKSDDDYRLWSAEKMAELGDRFAEAGFQPFLVFGPGQESAARNIASRMHCEPIADSHTVATFAALKEVIAACAVFVGIDGGPKHLAIASGTPSVSLYHRAHKAVIWNPPGNPRHRVVAPRAGLSRDLVIGDLVDVERLADVSVDVVWEQVEAIIGEGGQGGTKEGNHE